METVSVMFYWGGNTLEHPEEGFSYDIPPKGFYELPLPMSLVELESMLMPKVASSGETGRLTFTCRFPFRTCQNVIKYRPFPINDDESFSTLLKNCSIFLMCPEIYVQNIQIKYTYGEEQMMLSPTPLVSFNAAAKRLKQSKQLLTSTSPKKFLPAAEIVENNMDLLTRIFLRVPAKSLIKFKCVSKHWLSLISDSQFGSNHTRRNPIPLVSGIYLYSRCRARNQLSLNVRFLPVSIGGRLRSSLPTFSFLHGVMAGKCARVIDFSNGLMLCCNGSDHDKIYIVCNLTTQKFIALPKHSPSPESRFGEESYLVFDPAKSPYYKIVLVGRPYNLNVSELSIYSSECASWKNVSVTKPIRDDSGHGTIWNESIIWRRWSMHEYVYSRLDVDTEKLTTTRVTPDPNLSEGMLYFGECGGHLKGILYFGECGGHLLLIQRPTPDAQGFRVLEMDRDDFRWTERYLVDLRSTILGNVGRSIIYVISVVKGTNENDITVVFHNRGTVFSINLECRTMKFLGELSGEERRDYGQSDIYKRSYQFIESLSPV